MPRSRELRGVVVPDVDDRALRSNVADPIDRTLDSLGNLGDRLGLGGLSSDLGGLGSGVGGGSTSGRMGDSIAVAQLEALEDIHETLRGQDGRGGGGGLLSGLAIGSRLGGIGSAIGGGAGALGLAGTIGAGALLQDQLGEVSIWRLFDFQTSPGGRLANALTGGLAGAAVGFGNILLEQVGDVGEALGLVEDAEAFEQRLLSGITSAGDAFRSWIDYGIRGFRSMELPDFSSLSLPSPIRRFVDVLGGDLGGAPPVNPSAPDMGLGQSDQGLLNAQRRQQRQQEQQPTVRPSDLDPPKLEVGEINIDPQRALDDLQRQVKREWSDLERRVGEIEYQLDQSFSGPI